jgi:hypothetical protein
MDLTQLKKEFLSAVHHALEGGVPVLELAQLLEAFALVHSEPIHEVPVFDKVFGALKDAAKDDKLDLAERLLKIHGFGL